MKDQEYDSGPVIGLILVAILLVIVAST